MVSPKTGKGWCVQLSLVAEVWDDQCRWYTTTAHAPRILCLWRMSREKRVLLWEELQPQLQLRELGLGGEWDGVRCPVDDKEFTILCPKGSLHELQQLVLHAADRVTNTGLQTLASAGCGTQLTSLTLWGE